MTAQDIEIIQKLSELPNFRLTASEIHSFKDDKVWLAIKKHFTSRIYEYLKTITNPLLPEAQVRLAQVTILCLKELLVIDDALLAQVEANGPTLELSDKAVKRSEQEDEAADLLTALNGTA